MWETLNLVALITNTFPLFFSCKGLKKLDELLKIKVVTDTLIQIIEYFN